jgi:DNA repair ATPase RecN
MSGLISMNDYTPEQIEQAKEYLNEILELGRKWKNNEADHYNDSLAIILAALKAAEKERDALAAYAAKLEKAGDFMRRACPMIVARDNWDAARKEKP